MRLDVRATVAGFAGAIAVLALLAWVVGIEELFAALSMASPAGIAAVLGAAVVWLVAWAFALATVLSALGAPISAPRAVAVYAGVLFSNNVTPFGQAGGEPISALLISESADTAYENALAAIASADSINFVPSTALALIGVTYYSVAAAAGDELRVATAAVALLAVGMPIAGVLAWRNRERLEAGIGRTLTPIAKAVGRRVPRLSAPTRNAIESRVDGFFRSLEDVATDRRSLATAIGFSTVGWTAQATALWCAFYAIGVPVQPEAVLVAVPVGAIAGVTPLPGGLGGVEAALIGLLVPLAGVSAATAAAAIVLHRGAIYWLPTFIGGGVAAALAADR
ncbi:MAG: hypothetical protein ACI8U4_001147 [Natronomonas sp.]|jgi:uncharacterized protein (TIRG00374 family)